MYPDRAFPRTYLDPAESDTPAPTHRQTIPNSEVMVLREDGTPVAPMSKAMLVNAARLVGSAIGMIGEKTDERFKPLPAKVCVLRASCDGGWRCSRRYGAQPGRRRLSVT